MINIKTKAGYEVYLAKSTIKEIVFNPNGEEAMIYTDKNSHKVDVDTAKKLVSSINERNTEHLVTAINSLTHMIRARVH